MKSINYYLANIPFFIFTRTIIQIIIMKESIYSGIYFAVSKLPTNLAHANQINHLQQWQNTLFANV